MSFTHTSTGRTVTIALALALATLGDIGSGAVQAKAKGCPAAVFVGVRGTNDGKGFGRTIEDVRVKTEKAIPPEYVIADHYIDYPAVIAPTAKTHSVYPHSLGIAEAKLRSYLKQWNEICPGMPFALAGYSQGADAVLGVYQTSPYKKQIYAVAALGDPRFNPGSKAENVGDFQNIPGIIAKFSLSFRVYGKSDQNVVRSYCVKGDAVCNASKANIASCYPPDKRPNCGHFHYSDRKYRGVTYTNLAARWIVSRLQFQG